MDIEKEEAFDFIYVKSFIIELISRNRKLKISHGGMRASSSNAKKSVQRLNLLSIPRVVLGYDKAKEFRIKVSILFGLILFF